MSDVWTADWTCGPIHRWFAWRPVNTHDRGWRWLRIVHRRRVHLNITGRPQRTWFAHSVTAPRRVAA